MRRIMRQLKIIIDIIVSDDSCTASHVDGVTDYGPTSIADKKYGHHRYFLRQGKSS